MADHAAYIDHWLEILREGQARHLSRGVQRSFQGEGERGGRGGGSRGRLKYLKGLQ